MRGRLTGQVKRTSTYVLTAAGNITLVNQSVLVVNKTVGEATTVTLPAGLTAGHEIVVKDGKGDAATNNITITPASGNIDGAASIAITENYGAVTLVYNGTQWNVTAARGARGHRSVLTLRTRVTTAEVNAGLTLLPAIVGKKYRLVDCTLIAIGGNAATATTVDILGTIAASGSKLIAAAVAALTRSTVVKPDTASVTVLADGGSFVQCDANTAITIGKTGGSLATATHIDVLLTYTIEE